MKIEASLDKLEKVKKNWDFLPQKLHNLLVKLMTLKWEYKDLMLKMMNLKEDLKKQEENMKVHEDKTKVLLVMLDKDKKNWDCPLLKLLDCLMNWTISRIDS